MAPTRLSEVTRGGRALNAFGDLSPSHADCASGGSLARGLYDDQKRIQLFGDICEGESAFADQHCTLLVLLDDGAILVPPASWEK